MLTERPIGMFNEKGVSAMCMRGRDRDTSPYDLHFECVNIILLATHDIGYEPSIAYYNKESRDMEEEQGGADLQWKRLHSELLRHETNTQLNCLIESVFTPITSRGDNTQYGVRLGKPNQYAHCSIIFLLECADIHE